MQISGDSRYGSARGLVSALAWKTALFSMTPQLLVL